MFVRDGLALLDVNLSEQVHIAPISRDIHAMLWFARQLPLQDVPHLVAKRHVLAFAVQCAGCHAGDLQDGFMQQRMLGEKASCIESCIAHVENRNRMMRWASRHAERGLSATRLESEITTMSPQQRVWLRGGRPTRPIGDGDE